MRQTRTVAVPAYNEAGTIGSVVSALREDLLRPGSIDEIIVIDDGSTDDTARLARRAGARVITTSGSNHWSEGREHVRGGRGKGAAMRASLDAATTEVICWVDGDVSGVDFSLFTRLFEPLSRAEVRLVKGTFQRVNDGIIYGPGRVTALTARPLLSLVVPELSWMSDPLSGVAAGRVSDLRLLDFELDYGVDIGLAIDVCQRWGKDSVAEVNLGRLAHRRRSLSSLEITATQVARTILGRSSHWAVCNSKGGRGGQAATQV
jgi:glucosyl-3-phosphoglycerate synthase